MSDLRIPPLRAIGIDRKEIETLRHEHHEISGQLAMSEAEVQNLEARRPQAQQADAATAAKVIRQGKKSPANATKNEEKLEEEIKRARRRCAALQQAQIDISGEISTFLSEHAGELLEEARATLEGAKATQLSAVSDLEAARSRRFQVLQAVDWISRYVPTEPLETAEAGDYFEVIL